MKRFFKFLSEVRRELFERTTWPTRDDVLNMTSFVVFSLIVVSIFLFFVDYFSNKAINYVTVVKVDFLKNWMEWVIEPIWGIPWRFFGIVFVIGFIFYIFGKIRKGQS